MKLLKKHWLPFVTPLLIIFSTFTIVSFVGKQLLQRNQQLLEKQFEFETQRVTSKIEVRIISYTQLLRGASGFFAGSKEVTRKEWHDYVEKLDLDQNYKGLQGLGFTKLIPAKQLDKHISELRKEGFPDYVVTPEGMRDVYTSIIYLEPFSGRNLRAFGYDMFSESTRHKAMEKARDTGATVLSGKVMLLQETKTDVQAGTLAYHPVYSNNAILQTVEQRQAALIGWVYSPYRMNDLMNSALESDLTNVRLEIFDGNNELQADKLLYDSRSKSDTIEKTNMPTLSLVKTIEMEGCYWTLRYSALPAFFGKEKYGSNWIELTGLSVIVILSFMVAGAFFNTRQRAEIIAKTLTSSLHDNEEQLNVVMQSTQVAIFLSDSTGHLVFVNPAALKTLGYQLEELIGKSATILLEHHEIIRAARYIEEGIKQQLVDNWLLKTKSGKPILFELTIQVLNDGRFLTTGNDITERNKIETSLRESEQRFRLMADSAPVFIWITDNFKACTWFNRKWGDFIGLTIEDNQNSGWEHLLHSDDIKIRSEHFDSHEPFSIIYRSCRYDGEWRWILENALPRFDEANKFLGYIGSGVDITEQKQYEKELLEAREIAELANMAKSEFLANMSHEIRTPMNAVIGLTQLALNTELTAQQHDYLEKILGSSQHLLSVLNDILDLSKIEANKLTMVSEPFDLDELIHNLNNLFLSRANEQNLEFGLKIDSDVPRHLMGDALRLQQVLINLLANALKFTKTGFIHLVVNKIETKNHQIILKFTVRDSGIGITEETQHLLFQPFTQGDNSITRRFGGTGLGLSISSRLVKLMGGEIQLFSEQNVGSSFSFEVAFELADDGFESTSFHKKMKPFSLPELKKLSEKLAGKRILLVEDNPLNQQVASEFLKSSGLKVVIANNGEEALTILDANMFDAIFMDIQMPIMDGLKATKLIRQQEKFVDLPIIAMSAGVTLDEQEKCQRSGMNDFVAKPINPVEMLEKLVELLHSDKFTKSFENSNTSEIHGSNYEYLEGLDVKRLEQLEMMLGSQEKVWGVLTTFIHDFNSVLEDLDTLLQKNEIEKACEKLHSLKGCASNIGALNLSKLAATLESSLITNSDITELVFALKNAWEVVDNTIKNFKQNNVSSLLIRESSVPEFKIHLIELEKQLRSNSFISGDLLEQLDTMSTTQLDVEQTAKFKQLLIAVHNFDYDEALKNLSSIYS
jgi:PAS domain S-box-containing protein